MKSKIIGLLLLIIISGCAKPVVVNQNNIETEIIDNFIETGKFYEVFKLYSAGINSEHINLQSEINYWFALIKLNRLNQSIEYIRQLIEKYKSNVFYSPRISNVKIIPLLKYLEGYTYIYIGNYEESIKSFDYFLNSKNEFSDIETLIQDNYLKLTLCNLKLNRYDAAENNFELYGKNKVVDRFADEALYYKSNIELGPDEKMQIDDQISGDTSRLINAMFYASLYKELHKNASLKNEAFNADCDYILGTAMNKLGRPEVAVKLFNRFLSNSGYNDKTDKTLYLLAKYYGETDKNLALSYYRQLVNGFLKSPYWTESFYFLVQYYFNEKKYSEIIKYAEVLKMKMLDEKTVKSYRFEFDDLLYYFALSYEMNVYYKEAVELYELYKTKFKTGLHIEDIELRLKKIKFK